MKIQIILMIIMVIVISSGVEGKFYEAKKDLPPKATLPLLLTPENKYYLPFDVGTPPQVSSPSSLLLLLLFLLLYIFITQRK